MDMKKNILVFLSLLLLTIFLLSGCSWLSSRSGSSDVEASIYYIEENGTALLEMNVSLPDGSEEEKVEYLVNNLLNPPQNFSSLCDGAKLLSVKIKDEIAVVNFSKEFSSIKDPIYTLSPAALAKTLCSLEFISGVNILVEGSPALGIDGTPIGLIMKSDVMGDGLPAGLSSKSIKLYFSDEAGEGLNIERREVLVPASTTVEKVVVEELIKGPKNAENLAIVPPDVRVLSAETKNGVCFVNLSKEFKSSFTGGSTGEILTIYSIVNSLTELETIKSVQFLIEGEKKDALSHMAINEPITRNKSIIIE